jgi:hypothetical protein
MNRTLKITALSAAACGVIAVPALAADDPTALVQTAQSKPVQIDPGDTHTVLGQAGITSRGKLIVRLAMPSEDGDAVIAQTSKVIDDEYAGNPKKAKLSIRLKRDRTGVVSLRGPEGRHGRPAADYRLRWSVEHPSIRIVRAQSAQVAAAPALGKICGTGRDSGELVTRAGKGSSCRSGLPLMRAWRAADNPRRFRSYRCGDVPGARVEFRGDQRWFASWQCIRGPKTYRVWTQL